MLLFNVVLLQSPLCLNTNSIDESLSSLSSVTLDLDFDNIDRNECRDFPRDFVSWSGPSVHEPGPVPVWFLHFLTFSGNTDTGDKGRETGTRMGCISWPFISCRTLYQVEGSRGIQADGNCVFY
jgi:hypothetical protein